MRDTSPSATDSQITQTAISVMIPAAPSQATGPAPDRNPISTATPSTRTTAITVWIRLPMTWPASTAGRKIAMVRNRVMIPSFMSVVTPIAVFWPMPATVISRMPGTR